MLPPLKNSHKEHLNLVLEQPAQIVGDFCKMSLDFLKNGPNEKQYAKAAQKLNVEVEDVQNTMSALIYLLMISRQHKLTENDFKEFLISIGFTKEQQELLLQFYTFEQSEVVDVLRKLSVKDEHFYDLDWRFEVLVSSRALLHQANPIITMDLSLKSNDTNEKISHKLLQTDPMNLAHITSELERAMQESKSQYSRRIQRAFNN